MSSTVEFVEYACEQVRETGAVRYRKMFGEYMVYVDDKPILLICDDTVFVKILPAVELLLAGADKGFPYPSAKEHYILDIDNAELAREVVETLLPITAVPVKRMRKAPKKHTEK
jgi:TfoX/Sxy family transcriptional regulator of competence genes